MCIKEKLRKGDAILISDLTRLSRSIKNLFSLVDQIHFIIDKETIK